MTWRRDKLPELVRAMSGRPRHEASGRPRHEALRGHVTELLREGVGAPYDEIAHELYLLDDRGRIDTMWGATVIELKSDLRRELADVQARMPDYLADAARRTRGPCPVTGIATDGATFIGYQLIDGALTELRRYETDPERPNELMAWLEPLLSERSGVAPEARSVAQAFGKGSLTFSRARLTLDKLWADLAGDPEVRLKRDLWDRLLREAYGVAAAAIRAEAVAARVSLDAAQHFVAKRRANLSRPRGRRRRGRDRGPGRRPPTILMRSDANAALNIVKDSISNLLRSTVRTRSAPPS